MSDIWTSAGAWMLHTAVGGGLLLLVTCVLTRWTPQPARRQRLGDWGLMAALLVAVLSGIGPSWLVIAWSREEPARASAQLPSKQHVVQDVLMNPVDFKDELAPREFRAVGLEDGPASLTQVSGEEPTAFEEKTALDGSSEWTEHAGVTLILAASGVAVFFALRLLIGYVALLRLLVRSESPPEDVRGLFETMAAGTRWVRLLVSRRLLVPLSCGLVRPTVVLPAAMCRRPAPRQLRWVFAHELTHLRRCDAWSALLFNLGQVFFFAVPWFWWLRRQVRLCQEYVADAAAAGQDEGSVEYAEFLVSLANAPAVPVGASAVSGNCSDLLRRVTMLLKDPLRVETRCPRLWSLLVAGGLVSLAVLVSGFGYRAEAAADDDTIVIIIRSDGGKGPTEKQPAQLSSGSKDGGGVLLLQDGKVIRLQLSAEVQDKEKVQDTAKKGEPQPVKRYSLKFSNAKWSEVLDWLKKVSGMPISTGGVPTGTLTFIPPNDPETGKPKQYTLAEAVDVLNEEVLLHKFIIMRRERTIAIWPVDEPIPLELVKTVPVEELESIDMGKSEYVRTIIQLKNLKADTFAPGVRKMMSPFGRVIPLEEPNQLILVENVGNLRIIAATIKKIESDPAKATPPFSGKTATPPVSSTQATSGKKDKTAPEKVQKQIQLKLLLDKSDGDVETIIQQIKAKIISKQQLQNTVVLHLLLDKIDGDVEKALGKLKIKQIEILAPQKNGKEKSAPESVSSVEELLQLLKLMDLHDLKLMDLNLKVQELDKKSADQVKKALEAAVPYLEHLPAKPADPTKPAKPADPAKAIMSPMAGPTTTKAISGTTLPLSTSTTISGMPQPMAAQGAAKNRLGVAVEAINPAIAEHLKLPANVGLLVTQVVGDGPAAKVGIAVNDILVKIGSATVPANVGSFAKFAASLKAETALEVVVIRKGKTETVGSVTLAAVKITKVDGTSTSYFKTKKKPDKLDDKDAVTTTVTRKGDVSTITHTEGSLTLSVSCIVKDGQVFVGSIEVKDGKTTQTYAGVGDVPEAHRSRIQQLVEAVGRLGAPAAKK